MPTIDATPLPDAGWVRVEVDWSDTPGTEYVRVERVTPSTGEVYPLRPHTDYSGWYQRLSGGRALLYDTEAPLDTPFYYRTASRDAPDVFPTVAARDTYDREPTASGWGSTTTGETWTTAGGSASDFTIVGV